MIFIRNIISYVYLKSKKVDTKFGYVTLNGFPMIVKSRGSTIKIGKGVTLNSSFKSNIAGINHPIILAAVGENASIIIENNCGLSGNTIVAVTKVLLEDGVGLGANSSVYDTDFHPIDFRERAAQKSINDAATSPVVIKSGTLIGANTIILKGVTIGNRCFIGANSVVTKSIGNDFLAAGNPASEIKKINICN